MASIWGVNGKHVGVAKPLGIPVGIAAEVVRLLGILLGVDTF
jgi:hypothetical protein